MPDLAPLDDIKTYRKVADDAYAKKMSQGIANPRAALANRMKEAGVDEVVPIPPADSPASAIPGVKFTKGFTPEERATQQKALALKLKQRGD